MTSNVSITKKNPKREWNWPQVLIYAHVHIFSIYAIYCITKEAYISTTIFAIFMSILGYIAMTAGAHRVWGHRSYKASKPLRIFLMLAFTFVGTGTIYNWVRRHRLHHKYLGTDKDPHNISRGFFYAHVRSNIEVPTEKDEELLKEIDMSDIEEDGVVMFQKNYYWPLAFLITFLLPINAPVEYWGETPWNSLFVVGCFSHLITLNAAWLINSGILIWGLKENDKYPADTNLVFILTKSYWPHYHYTIPWDFQTGEYGAYGDDYITTLIRIWTVLELASDLRTTESSTIREALVTSVSTGQPVVESINQISTTKKQSWDAVFSFSKTVQ